MTTVGRVKRKKDIVGKVGQVVDGLLERQVLQILGIQDIVWARLSPVAVYM